MSLSGFKDLADIIQAVVTSVGLVAAGVWAYRKYILQSEGYPHIETTSEVEFIGLQGDSWIVEIRAILENKSKVEHRIEEFKYCLNGISSGETIGFDEAKGNQIKYSEQLGKGSFLREGSTFFAIGPLVTAKYARAVRIPKQTSFLTLNCRFNYEDGRKYKHAMNKTVAVPDQLAEQ